ncbi:sugar kinase [Chitinimonas koreensis]|uniref:sugar kinase n=1 Tax=Chitinimonas koreensis TaxID=356302 RepID=UPI00041021FB|nr:sugar kinase [Chitinimonas koreensis]QNM98783.1 sugar kinase [Chitinimonas koreensis]
MTPPRFDLVGIGECMVELYADQPLGLTPTLQRAYGGDVLNTLVTAARLGARTGFVSRVGDDPFGAGLRAAWQAEGVDTAQAPLVAGENGIYFISLLPGGEREFTYRRGGSAASQLLPEQLDESYLASAGCLLLSGITQAISPGAEAATHAAARIARRHGVRVAYDPNYRPRLWAGRGGLPAARAAFDSLLPLVDWLLPSHPADAALLGLSDEDAAAVLHAFADRGPQVALKCGADGCRLAVNGVGHRVAADPVDSVVDSTGAGDAWNGGFLFHLARGLDPVAAARQANRLAAAKLAHRGAIPPRAMPA